MRVLRSKLSAVGKRVHATFGRLAMRKTKVENECEWREGMNKGMESQCVRSKGMQNESDEAHCSESRERELLLVRVLLLILL